LSFINLVRFCGPAITRSIASAVYEVSNISVDSLTDFQREALERSIATENLEEARRVLDQLGGN
jgi:hypothetical protein